MRAIYKDLTNIPKSLRTDAQSILRRPAKTTYNRRLQVIANAKYPAVNVSSTFDNRYRTTDIKEMLDTIYLGKCAFCESRVEQITIDHYRPKRGGYYWLAYSWDNLLYVCPKCNEYKGNTFPVLTGKVVYDPVRDTMENIHHLGECYDLLETPQLINPERVTPSELNSVQFDKDGHIFSNNSRINQTINVCKLDRKSLCESRKKIWDDFRNEILIAVSLAKEDKEELRIRLNQVIVSYLMKCKDINNDYTAYRNYVIKESWISDFVKELIGE